MKQHLDPIKKYLSKEIDPAFSLRAEFILRNIPEKKKLRILEIGCGRGFYEGAVATLFPSSSITGIDLNGEYVSQAKRNIQSDRVHFATGDATRLSFPDNFFDIVLCTEVLEHITSDRLVLQEMYRVLKKGGKAIITVPHKNYPFFWDPANFMLERLFGWHLPSRVWWLSGIWADHVRLYSEKELETKIENAGFRVTAMNRLFRYAFPFSHFLLYGVGKNLVELGVGKKSLNRFTASQQVGMVARLIKMPFYMFQNVESPAQSNERFLNFGIIVSKHE